MKTCEECGKKKIAKRAIAIQCAQKVYVPITQGFNDPSIPSSISWYLHVGTVNLYIVGPGPSAMLRCSEPYYTGEIGSDEEKAIARIAVDQLNRELEQNISSGPEIIVAALEKAKAQYHA